MNHWSTLPGCATAIVLMHFAHYNFVRRHITIKTVPVVAAGVEGSAWGLAEFVEWTDLYGH